MYLKSFFSFALWFICSVSAFASCINQESTEIEPPGLVNIRLVAKSCSVDDKTGHVTIDVMKNGDVSQTLKASFESNAYVLNVDPTFDIDLDGIPDLTVSTGKGRGGDGMHYWRFDKAVFRYVDLGEAPTLSHAKSGEKSTLFTLESSNGEFQSIRYNYKFSKNKLKIISAIGFIRKENSDDYYIVHLVPKSQFAQWRHDRKITVKGLIAEKCMDGTGICP